MSVTKLTVPKSLVATRKPHFFSNNSWAAYDDGTGPITRMPYRPNLDGVFVFGLRLVYDPLDDVVLAATGFQQQTPIDTPPQFDYGTVFVLDVHVWTWSSFHADYTPDPVDPTQPPFPNQQPDTIVSAGMVILSTLRGKHELIVYGGIDVTFAETGGFCYILDVPTRRWRSELTCSYSSGNAPFFLADTAYAVNAEGSSAMVVGGRNCHPDWASAISIGVWSLSLSDYVWTLQTVVADVSLLSLAIYPFTAVRSSLFVVPRQACSNVQACGMGTTMIVWGGLLANASLYQATYDLVPLEYCSRFFGGQWANARYISVPNIVHVVKRAVQCDHRSLPMSQSSMMAMLLLCCVLVVGVVATAVRGSAACARAKPGIMSSMGTTAAGHVYHSALLAYMHSIADALGAASALTLLTTCSAALASTVVAPCSGAARQTCVSGLWLCVCAIAARVALLFLSGLLRATQTSAHMTTRSCGGSVDRTTRMYNAAGWSKQASILSYRAQPHAASSTSTKFLDRLLATLATATWLLLQPVAAGEHACTAHVAQLPTAAEVEVTQMRSPPRRDDHVRSTAVGLDAVLLVSVVVYVASLCLCVSVASVTPLSTASVYATASLSSPTLLTIAFLPLFVLMSICDCVCVCIAGGRIVVQLSFNAVASMQDDDTILQQLLQADGTSDRASRHSDRRHDGPTGAGGPPAAEDVRSANATHARTVEATDVGTVTVLEPMMSLNG